MNFLSFLPNILATADAAAEAVKYGPIQKGFIIVIEWMFGLTGNWIWTIFLLALALKLLFQPLMSGQMRSSRKMALLQPELDELKQRYGNDQQRMQAEQMKLYKEHNIKPMAGCLPMIVNMALMIAIFGAVRNYVPADLTYFNWPLLGIENLSIIGKEVPGWQGWIMPVLCGAATFLSQWFTTPSQGNSQMKIMMIAMPIMFVWMVRSVSVFVGVYWFFYNLLNTVIQLPLMKYWEKKDKADIEATRKAKEDAAQARREKKEAAKKAAKIRQMEAAKKGKVLPKDRPAEFDFDAEDEEGQPIPQEKLMYDWVEWKGWLIKTKKERLHPFAEEAEVVETFITDQADELNVDQVRRLFQKEMNKAQGVVAEEQSAADALGLGGLFKKKKKEESTEEAKESAAEEEQEQA